MPIDSSSDPYTVSSGLDPLGAKLDGPERAKEADDTDEVDDDAKDLDAGSGGAATTKNPLEDIDDDLSRAGTGAATRVAAIDLDDVQKSALDDVDDLDAAGTGAGLKASLVDDDVDDAGLKDGLGAFADVDDVESSFDLKSEFDVDDDLDAGGSLKGAVDADDFDDPDPKFDDDPDDPSDVDGDDKGFLDLG